MLVASIFSYSNNFFQKADFQGLETRDSLLTLSETTNFRLFQIKEFLQTTILNLMKMAGTSPNG